MGNSDQCWRGIPSDACRGPIRSEGRDVPMKKTYRIVLAAICAFALAAAFGMAGCSSENKPAEEPSGDEPSDVQDHEAVELQIFAANSLSKAMEEVQNLYLEDHGWVSFADTQYEASGTLNEMLGAGSSADILITASKATMDTAVEEGYVDAGQARVSYRVSHEHAVDDAVHAAQRERDHRGDDVFQILFEHASSNHVMSLRYAIC